MWFLLTIIVQLIVFANASKCKVSLKSDLQEKSPLILHPTDTHWDSAFIQPNSEGIIWLNDSQKVLMACPGGNLVVNNKMYWETQTSVQCNSGKFYLLSVSAGIANIKCSQIPKATTQYTSKSCLIGRSEIAVGFHLIDRFIPFIKVCFDRFSLTTLYTEHNIPKDICEHQINIARIDFSEDNLFQLPEHVNEIYKKSNQRQMINHILGLPSSSQKYIKDSSNYYLCRGHLAAKVDFLYAAQQRGSFKFINALPQWQSLNLNQWLTLENDIRAYSCNTELGLVAYTGGFGVMTLPHDITGLPTKIYLYNTQIPVPKYFWKVIHDPSKNQSLAFITLNNPYSNESLQRLCRNVCASVPWLKRSFGDVSTTCCSVQEARNIITNIPYF